LPSLSSPSYQHYPALNQSDLHEPLAYSRLSQPQQQMPITRPAPTNPLTPPSMSSPQMMNNSLLNNVVGNVPVMSIPGAFSSPLATGSTSPRYAPGGLSLSPRAHTRQASFGQIQHSPHHSHSNRPPIPGQSFASLPQTW
jgi:hypothetical protein